jgi:hypothetical protein
MPLDYTPGIYRGIKTTGCLFGILFDLTPLFMDTINVTVRCLAYGGKFIGKGMNFAQVVITEAATGANLASGIANQYDMNISGDGSGILRDIMSQPYLWGTPVNPETAASFTAPVKVTRPGQILVTVSVNGPDGSTLGSVSLLRWIFPGVDMTGKKAIQAVIQGLAVSLVPGKPAPANTLQPVTAYLTMMCGCKIENVNWPGDDFDVQATLTLGATSQTVPLIYVTTPGTVSTFTGSWMPPAAGNYAVAITAVQRSNGNTAFATGTIAVL